MQETKAPEGFCLDTKQYPFELVYADENTPIVYVDMERENLPTTLKLLKSDIDGLVLDGITFEMTESEILKAPVFRLMEPLPAVLS
mgnify:CR=1 FL=1